MRKPKTGLDRLWLRSGFPNNVLNAVLGHPVVGASREGFVIKNLLSCLPTGVTPWFYQISAGAEIDLAIEQGNKKFVIEIKRSLAQGFSKGFHLGCEDIGATKRFIVYSGKERFLVTKEVTAIPLLEMMNELREIK